MRIRMNGKVVEIPRWQQEDYVSTPEEQMLILKQQLADTDYKAIKYAEGWYTEEEYAPIKAERQAIRDKINELEAEL